MRTHPRLAVLSAATVALAAAAFHLPAQAADVAPAVSLPADHFTAQTPDARGSLESTIAIKGCSASWVRFPGHGVNDKAVMLTNGHCLTMMRLGVVKINERVEMPGKVLNKSGMELMSVTGTRVLYGTMTGTDAAFIELDVTHQDIRSKTGQEPLLISDRAPVPGERINVPSGFWKTVYVCEMEAVVHRLKEMQWVWRDSLRYKLDLQRCKTKGGTSGSPVISMQTGEVVGVNNTRADGGIDCGMNNPCELDASGRVTMKPKYAYGQNTHWIVPCLTPSFEVNVNAPGCHLSKPGDRE